jgi:transposase
MTKTRILNYQYGLRPPTQGADLAMQVLTRAYRYHTSVVRAAQELHDARAEIKEQGGEIEESLDAVHLTFAASTRDARKHSGINDCWGTYQMIDEAAQAALRSGERPRVRAWDGTGALAVHIQGEPLSVEDLEAGEHSFARLSGEGRTRLLSVRLGSVGREPIWGVWPVICHRSLPPDSRIRWVKIHRLRTATHYRWEATITVDTPAQGLRTCDSVNGGPTIAIDIGWRRMRDGTIRVAAWADSEGRSGDLRLDKRIISRIQKVWDLESIRAKAFDAAIADLRSVRPGIYEPWFLQATRTIHAWESPQRLAALVGFWRGKRFSGDAQIYERMEAWRKQDKHLYEWECHQRENVLRHRREIYRLFSVDIARHYRQVIVEQLDLRDFAELPKAGEPPDDPQTKAARTWRTFAALSELRLCVKNACANSGAEHREEEAAWTTQTCADCQEQEPFDAAPSVDHTCSHCGATWDQDLNAARNLLRAERSSTTPPERSPTKDVDNSGKTAAQLRRERGLTTRRSRRSKTMVVGDEIIGESR